MASKEEAAATARALLEQLKEIAATEEVRSEFSRVMASAQDILVLENVLTGTLTSQQQAEDDMFVELREVKFSGPETYTVDVSNVEVLGEVPEPPSFETTVSYDESGV